MSSVKTVIAIAGVLLVGCAKQSFGQDGACQCALPPYECIDACSVIAGYLTCLFGACVVCGGESTVEAACQQTLDDLAQSTCSWVDCGTMSCSSYSGCGTAAQQLSIIWIVAIAVGAAAVLLVVISILIGFCRRWQRDTYHAINA